MRVAHAAPFEKYNAILAEDLNAFFPQGTYRDLLTLESDIAQIASLILVFSESYGSAAELGAFAMLPEISQRLLVVMDDKRYNENSFIKLGPLLSLSNSFGENAICVLNHGDLGIDRIDKLEKLDVGAFSYTIEQSISERIKGIPKHSTFNQKINGHVIKLIVGLIQWYGALTLEELEVALFCLNVECQKERISDFLLCAQFAKWIIADKRGVKTYYVAIAQIMAVKFHARPGKEMVSRIRWQAAIRDYWGVHDRHRFSCIANAIKGN
jgi:hypothetical protein